MFPEENLITRRIAMGYDIRRTSDYQQTLLKVQHQSRKSLSLFLHKLTNPIHTLRYILKVNIYFQLWIDLPSESWKFQKERVTVVGSGGYSGDGCDGGDGSDGGDGETETTTTTTTTSFAECVGRYTVTNESFLPSGIQTAH
ncbi:hypothetical protein M0802_006480 [Mischocyttarus mexicanus]|nr:hypothetical protein M0802_006480 [Mischocyttarus mexicanus]